MNYIIALVGVLVLLISRHQFKKAAGDISISKMNIISFVYYNLVVFTYIGAMIVLLGYKDHYMIEKIEDWGVIYKTCVYIGYVMIMLPIAIRAFSKLFIRGNIAQRYTVFLEKHLEFEATEKIAFYIAIAFTLIGIFSTAYMFHNMGGIPLLSVFKARELAAKTRISVTHDYAGNSYFRNIVVLMITPLISYFCYIYMRKSRTRKLEWSFLFVINAVITVLIKTYNLEKSPVIYWLFYFYIIEIMLGNPKATRILKKIFVIGVIAVLGMYLFSGHVGGLISLSSGPLSRIIMTQASTLFLHIQVFPKYHLFLNGASLPSAVSWLFGTNESWVRSGKIVMETYNARGIAAGEAGVMNALFIGEAYANWGVWGVILSPIIVAIPFVITYGILLRQRKTPLNMVLYIGLFMTFTNSLQGGIVDYIYNINFIILVLFAASLSAFAHAGKVRI